VGECDGPSALTYGFQVRCSWTRACFYVHSCHLPRVMCHRAAQPDHADCGVQITGVGEAATARAGRKATGLGALRAKANALLATDHDIYKVRRAYCFAHLTPYATAECALP